MRSNAIGADGIAMAPIAHKGVVAGAKVQAMTLLDLIMSPRLVADAKDYFVSVQTKTIKYRPLMAPTDQPAIRLNAEKMAKYRELGDGRPGDRATIRGRRALAKLPNLTWSGRFSRGRLDRCWRWRPRTDWAS